MRISDWSSDVCSSDLFGCDFGAGEHARDFLAAFAVAQRMDAGAGDGAVAGFGDQHMAGAACGDLRAVGDDAYLVGSGQAGQALPDSGSDGAPRSEEHTSELQ